MAYPAMADDDGTDLTTDEIARRTVARELRERADVADEVTSLATALRHAGADPGYTVTSHLEDYDREDVYAMANGLRELATTLEANAAPLVDE